MISIVLPTLNEVRHGYLERVLEAIKGQEGDFELIVSDSNSSDDTKAICESFADQFVDAGNCNRAMRMNRGAEAARGDILLFHHPVSILPADALKAITRALEDPEIVGGGFTHSFDHPQWQWNLAYTSWHSNKVRSKRGIIYLDHCLFVCKSVFQDIGGFPDIDIFEDTVFSLKMKKRGKLIILSEKIITSPRRFTQKGILIHLLKNQLMKLGFRCGISPKTLNKFYEGKDAYNVDYTAKS